MEEKEENGKELHNNELRGEALKCSQAVSNLDIQFLSAFMYLPSAFICSVCIHLVEVGALG